MEQTMDDIDFITDEIDAIKTPKVSHTRTVNKRKIKVMSGYEKARNNHKALKRATRRQLKEYKRQAKYKKLLLKKSRLEYKLLISNLSRYNRIRLALHLY